MMWVCFCVSERECTCVFPFLDTSIYTSQTVVDVDVAAVSWSVKEWTLFVVR